MTRQQDLDRLGHAIKDAEARLKVFLQTLDTIDKELADLGIVEWALEENINFLKTKHIIALATEYKKARQDLIKTKIRMSKIKIDRDSVVRAAKEVEEYLQKAKEDCAAILKSGNNVIVFRKKNAEE